MGCAVVVVACDQGPAPTTRFGSDLHANPAACGQAPYEWLDVPELGNVLLREELNTYEVDELEDVYKRQRY